MDKLFITTKNLNIGGVETSLVFLLNNLIEKYEIDLMVYEKGDLENKLNKKINIITYNEYFNTNLNTKFYRIFKNIKVNSLLKKYKNKITKEYDVSIAYHGFCNYIDMVAASVKSKKKLIWIHNDFLSSVNSKKFKIFYKLMYKLMGRKFRYFDKCVCVSKYTEENFKQFFKYDNTVTIHNYINGDNIQKLSLEKSNLTIDKEPFNIMACGRLTKLKNFNKLIDISNELNEKKYNFKVYIIGDGEEYEDLSNLINYYKLNDKVFLLGNLKNPYNILKEANLFVSMSEYESFGNVLIESMILSVPYLSNINSGSKDIYESITPTGLGKIVSNENMLKEIINLINKEQNKNIKFDYNKYNNDIMNKLYKEL